MIDLQQARYTPPIIQSGWLGEVRQVFETHQVGSVSDSEMLGWLGTREKRALRSIIGYRPKEILLLWRAQYAVWLIAINQASVAGAATEAGFYDSSHFARTTRRLLGLTPLQASRQLKRLQG